MVKKGVRAIKKEVVKKHFRVAIFGSARIKPNDSRYKLVFSLAKKIAAEGIDVVTGGGPGLMDAATRGHHAGRGKNNTHAIGLTIKLPREQKESFHLDIKRDFERFSERLDNFADLCNVFIVAPGGIGTTLEFFYMWQLLQVEHIRDIPIIMLGDMWHPLIDWVKEGPLRQRLLNKEDLNPIFFAKTVSKTMKLITLAHKHHRAGNEHICVNLQKAKIK